MTRDRTRSFQPRRGARVAATVAGLGLAVSGCSFLGVDDGPEAEPLPSVAPGAASSAPDGLAEFYTQQVSWRDCRAGDECAEVQVPLDYDDPQGPTLTLAMLRVPAQDQGGRVGALLVNPGGPGVSAQDYAAEAPTYFGEDLRRSFDIVGVDPRGVGESAPLDCVADDTLDEFVAADPDPDTPAEAAEAARLFRTLGQGCVSRSGDLAEHISTEESARDLDVVRAVLGQETLVYFGASYGTFLGATYADLFPERVGRMVLDGAVDPSVGLVELNLVQARGFETALRAYVADCVDGGDCYLGTDVESGLRRIRDLLDELDRTPLPAAPGRDLTEGLAVLGIWTPLYDERFWGLLDAALGSALEGDGRALLQLSDAYVSRGPEGYINNSIEALVAINCLDRDEWVPRARARALEPRFLEASPTFGGIFAFGLTGCRDWPVHTGKTASALAAEGAAPIVVVGTTRDPATPLKWAEGLAEQLESAVLVRRDGDGHTGYRAGNDCVDEVVEDYLLTGAAPEDTVDC